MNALMTLTHNPLACLTETPEAPVIGGLSAATEGQRVTLNCTVRCHCPSTHPTLRWIWEQGSHWNDTEHEEVQMVLTDPYTPTLLSSLSFTATYQLKPRLKCEVRHPGVRALVTAKTLHITCEQRLDFADIHKLTSSDTENVVLFFFASSCQRQFLLRTWWCMSPPSWCRRVAVPCWSARAKLTHQLRSTTGLTVTMETRCTSTNAHQPCGLLM